MECPLQAMKPACKMRSEGGLENGRGSLRQRGARHNADDSQGTHTGTGTTLHTGTGTAMGIRPACRLQR